MSLITFMAVCIVSCSLVSWQWINPRTLVLMDSKEKLRVVDRPSQEELETVDMAELQLVYNSSHFKSLATGGNVSQALVKTRVLICQSFQHLVWCMLHFIVWKRECPLIPKPYLLQKDSKIWRMKYMWPSINQLDEETYITASKIYHDITIYWVLKYWKMFQYWKMREIVLKNT